MAAGLGLAWPLPCPLQPGDSQPARLFLHLGKIWGLTRASKCPLRLLAVWAVKPCSWGDAELGFGAAGLGVSACAGLAQG